MEGGVEDGDVRDLGKELLCFTNPQQTPSIVNRSERNLRLDALGNVVIDAGGLGESLAAVDDAVANRIGREVRKCAARFHPRGLRITHALDRSGRDLNVAVGLE